MRADAVSFDAYLAPLGPPRASRRAPGQPLPAAGQSAGPAGSAACPAACSGQPPPLSCPLSAPAAFCQLSESTSRSDFAGAPHVFWKAPKMIVCRSRLALRARRQLSQDAWTLEVQEWQRGPAAGIRPVLKDAAHSEQNALSMKSWSATGERHMASMMLKKGPLNCTLFLSGSSASCSLKCTSCGRTSSPGSRVCAVHILLDTILSCITPQVIFKPIYR